MKQQEVGQKKNLIDVIRGAKKECGVNEDMESTKNKKILRRRRRIHLRLFIMFFQILESEQNAQSD